MKDACGHGSNANRVDFARNKIGLASSARFSRAGARPDAKMTADDHVAGLRARLSAPKGGLFHSFMQGVKSAVRG